MKSQNARRALCLCLALLGIAAFNASAAQASGWMLEGTELKSGQLPTVNINGHRTFRFNVLGIPVRILCTGMGTVGFHLVWPIRLLGRLRYLGCTVRIVTGGKEEEFPECTAHSAGQPAGVILSNELEGELTLVEKTGVVVLKPKVGTEIETIQTGELCPLGEEIPVEGKLAFKDSGGTSSLETEAKIHTLEEGPGTEMTALGEPATVGGQFEAELESIKQWSGLPG